MTGRRSAEDFGVRGVGCCRGGPAAVLPGGRGRIKPSRAASGALDFARTRRYGLEKRQPFRRFLFDSAAVLNTKVLVLNRAYLPIHITSVRRACSLLYQGFARAVDEQYQTFDFPTWAALSAELDDDTIGLVGRVMRVPRVILLVGYDRVPKRHVRFSRFNVYARDRNTCQYCGRAFPRSELNLDHVVPRSQGGTSTWENVVCSCLACNRRKGGNSPEQAGMALLRKPFRPNWTPFVLETFSLRRHREWLPFLSTVDAAYWNTELLDR